MINRIVVTLKDFDNEARTIKPVELVIDGPMFMGLSFPSPSQDLIPFVPRRCQE